MKLLTTQKNNLFDAIENTEMTPSLFEINETDSRIEDFTIATKISVKNQPYFFDFDSNHGQHYTFYSPGVDTYSGESFAKNWVSAFVDFKNWLYRLQRELNQEDKWLRLEKEITNIGVLKINQDEASEKFSIQEFLEIESKMNTLKENISVAAIELQLQPSALNEINAKLDYVVNQAKKLDKIGWKTLFVGAIITTVLRLGLTPENASMFWGIIKDTFSQIFLP